MGKFTWDYLMQVCWVLAFLGDLSRMLDGFCITCPQRLTVCSMFVSVGFMISVVFGCSSHVVWLLALVWCYRYTQKKDFVDLLV